MNVNEKITASIHMIAHYHFEKYPLKTIGIAGVMTHKSDIMACMEAHLTIVKYKE